MSIIPKQDLKSRIWKDKRLLGGTDASAVSPIGAWQLFDWCSGCRISHFGFLPASVLPRPGRRSSPVRRRGLAMLELVLALPILLFIMALIYNYGVVAAWKVRENSVARLAVWQTRWPRTRSDRSLAQLLARFGHDERLRPRQRARHGRQPRRSAGRPRPFERHDRQFKELLDETRGLRVGSGRAYPAIPFTCANSAIIRTTPRTGSLTTSGNISG